MTPEEVFRFALAIAMANAHPQAEEWAEKVVAAWESPMPETPAEPVEE